jgi:hypothetical protein
MNKSQHYTELTEMTFDSPKEEIVKLNFKKRKSEAFENQIEIGGLNFDTPISYFLKKFYKNDLSCYITHKEISINNTGNNFIFILHNHLLVTTKFEDEKNKDDYNYVKNNPILHKIDYKKVTIL